MLSFITHHIKESGQFVKFQCKLCPFMHQIGSRSFRTLNNNDIFHVNERLYRDKLYISLWNIDRDFYKANLVSALPINDLGPLLITLSNTKLGFIVYHNGLLYSMKTVFCTHASVIAALDWTLREIVIVDLIGY